ncbi:MAG: hydantoinase B/oxoprolinase family protein [Aurantimicrobium sp.]|nr:hydantoinase B/oxoprolinase family protein [Aurantimicrobium sp.]
MRTYRTDVIDMSVIANRLDGIVREMENTLLRAGRSAVLNMARDFSCSIITGDNRLLATAEGLPVHVIGGERLGEAMTRRHPDLREGDAFLHNDPYAGNTHAADHTLMVPVFVDGVHMFTTLAKAHQADIGNSAPTTYMPFAKDVYEEGALVFTAIKVQRDFTDIDDIITMCRSRIRVPNQWFGDYLAMVGAARIGERGLKALCDKYGLDVIKNYIEDWFDYSEVLMKDTISRMEPGVASGFGVHDPVGDLAPDGLTINVSLEIKPDEGRIVIDLRDNIDCIDGGMNESETCAINNAMTGVLNCLDASVPRNAGSFRCIEVLIRDNCIVGRPKFPHSTSVATTNVGERLVMITQRIIAERWPGQGMAEGSNGLGPGFAVISGQDTRSGNNVTFVNQLFIGSQGGPGGPGYDGWVTFGNSVTNGLMLRDSVEVDEQKYPILIRQMRVRTDSGGVGEWRGAPGIVCEYGPVVDQMTAHYVTDGNVNPPRGVAGGGDASPSEPYVLKEGGAEVSAPLIGSVTLARGEMVGHRLSGGGGYGNPHDRPAESVRTDVLAGFVSLTSARNDYGVAFVRDAIDASLEVDVAGTAALRGE